VQRYDFSANLQRNRKDFLRKIRKKRGEGTIIIGRGVDIPYYIIYIGDGRKTLPRPLCKRGEQIQFEQGTMNEEQ
jgi:hypothetical protein